MAGSEVRLVRVTRRLRPLRIGFLIRPGDRDALLRSIELNTCLWGGMFNPVIPVFRRAPRGWSGSLRPRSAADIVNGYLEAFDPDILVSIGLGDLGHRAYGIEHTN